jgi:hypothetical protein
MFWWLLIGSVVCKSVKDILSSGWEDDWLNHSWKEVDGPDELNWN